MIQLEVGGRAYPLGVGETSMGSAEGAAIPVRGSGVLDRHAILQGWADGAAAIRGLSGADVLVNGVRLGNDPTPILHGDKIQIGDTEILVVDPDRAGRTQIMNAAALADATAVAMPAPAGSTPDGRVVCLTDGREYAVGSVPLVFGREAGADVVIPSDEVSRRHAEIRNTEAGYVLVDLSANGTFVNDLRIDGARPLVRSDVIRVGPDEFRFHTSAGLPLGAAQRLADTMHGVPATPLPSKIVPSPPIASLMVRSGPERGTRFPIRSVVASVGRGEYNDVVLRDPSVSTMHAKLQRRDGVWVAVDLGSTNGTFVDDETVADETALSPGATIRFGEIAVMFEPLDDDMPDAAQGTQSLRRIEAAPMLPKAESVRARPVRPVASGSMSRTPAQPSTGGKRVWAILAVGAALIAAAVAAFMLFT